MFSILVFIIVLYVSIKCFLIREWVYKLMYKLWMKIYKFNVVGKLDEICIRYIMIII